MNNKEISLHSEKAIEAAAFSDCTRDRFTKGGYMTKRCHIILLSNENDPTSAVYVSLDKEELKTTIEELEACLAIM